MEMRPRWWGSTLDCKWNPSLSISFAQSSSPRIWVSTSLYSWTVKTRCLYSALWWLVLSEIMTFWRRRESFFLKKWINCKNISTATIRPDPPSPKMLCNALWETKASTPGLNSSRSVVTFLESLRVRSPGISSSQHLFKISLPSKFLSLVRWRTPCLYITKRKAPSRNKEQKIQRTWQKSTKWWAKLIKLRRLYNRKRTGWRIGRKILRFKRKGLLRWWENWFPATKDRRLVPVRLQRQSIFKITPKQNPECR